MDVVLAVVGLTMLNDGQSLVDSKMGRGVHIPLVRNSSCVNVSRDGVVMSASGNFRHQLGGGSSREFSCAANVVASSVHELIDAVRVTVCLSVL